MPPHITQEKLKELLDYDPETGILTWRVSLNWRIKVGQRAGTHNKVEGYRKIKIFGRMYREHRIVWLYVHGWLPERVDHDDGNGVNNRIGNLRDCTQAQNCANRKIHSNNESGYKGVWYSRQHNKWRAAIHMRGRKKHLGLFNTPELAHEFYCLAADMLNGEFSNHGTHKYQMTE
jgi:hypothetical protein